MNKLKELRTKNNISIKELSLSLKVTTKRIEAFENDNIVLDVESIKQLSRFFKVSTIYLLGLSDKTNESVEAIANKLLEVYINKLNKNNRINRIINQLNNLNDRYFDIMELTLDNMINGRLDDIL